MCNRINIYSHFHVTSYSALEVANQSRTSGCLVTSGHCWPSAADEEWYSLKGPSSTVTVNSSEFNTKLSFSIVYFIPARRNCLFLASCCTLRGTRRHCLCYALCGTRRQLAPLWWTFPALRCSDNAGVVWPSLSLS